MADEQNVASAAGSSLAVKAGVSVILIAMAVFLVTTGNAIRTELGRLNEAISTLAAATSSVLVGYEVLDKDGQVVGTFRRPVQTNMMMCGSVGESCGMDEGAGACGADAPTQDQATKQPTQ